MSAAAAARTAAIAIALGATTEAVIVLVALVDPPRIISATDVVIVRGEDAWHGNERASALLRWINVETVGPLVNQGTDSGFMPAWAEPPPPPDARLVRHAALGAGWPACAVACTWTTDRADVNFPPPIEGETSGDAPKEAARRLVAALRGEREPAGGHGAVRLLPAAALDSVLLALPWFAAILMVRRTRRGGAQFTPPG